MRILGHTIDGLVIQAIVAWDGVCTITPQKRDQIDAGDHAMMLARPVTMDQFDSPGIGLVQGGVIDNQETIMQRDVLFGLIPERCWVGVEAMEQAGQGVMSCSARLVGLDTCGFGTGEDHGRSNQKIDVFEVSHFGFVHLATIPHNTRTA
ncbi:MAG: hypothetical protein AVDCRST_MAG93-6855 [uncultured Chloroflexia bacterium]|uniref:Uncharacterized protein n=1 Tax=uncultured Chloroflexia bacterium TaxID=1672391 RepID=A0A6J4M3N9_9CHLR|nr:MAG: hypothetical protein AVDCRST_MAG93-6855 [uncultured Chloroflexia bacterium]